MPPIVRSGAFCVSGEKHYFVRDSGEATAGSTAMPTMGLLPAYKKLIKDEVI